MDLKQGLSSPNLRKIVEDRYGFLWLATQDGLNRFDGFSFIHINSSENKAGRQTIGNDFHDIVSDSLNNCIWAITSYRGLNKIDVTTCTVTGLFPLDPSRWYKSLSLFEKKLYIASEDGILFTFNTENNKFENYIDLTILLKKKCKIDKLFINDGNVWIFLNDLGVLILDRSLSKRIAFIESRSLFTNPDQKTLKFWDVLSTVNNQLVVATSYGLRFFDLIGKKLLPVSGISSKLPGCFLDSAVYAMALQNDHLFLSNKKGLFRVSILNGLYSSLVNAADISDNYWFTTVYNLFVENENIWFGNQEGIGKIENLKSPFTAYRASFADFKQPLTHCYHLYPLNDSILYSCAVNGLFTINLNQGTIKNIDNSQAYYQVFLGPNAFIIGSGEEILYAFKNNTRFKAADIFPELATIKKDFIISSFLYKDSLFFLASQNKKGIYVWNIKKRNLSLINDTTEPIKLKNLNINSFFLDSENRIWIICDNLISIYDLNSNRIRHSQIIDPLTKNPYSILFDVCETEGNYWLAVYGTGLIKIDDHFNVKEVVSTNEGITNTGLYKIYKANDSLLLTGSNNGLFFYNLKSKKVKIFTEEDGLHSNSFEETSGCRFKTNIFLGGIKGLTKIELKKIKNSSLPPVCFFTNIKVEAKNRMIDTFNLLFNRFTIPEDWIQTTVNFTSIYPGNPDKLSFSYRIEEINKKWILLGKRTFINLIGISPGTYHLQVQAFNEDGVPSEIKELTLIFLPKWYQTWWFKLLIVLAVIGAVYGLYRIRINQLKKEQQIRSKLASDLHDDLGSTMNSVKVYANLAIMEKQQEKYLIKIKESTQEAISGIRDIIWVLDDKKNSIEDLLARVGVFASPVSEANGIVYMQSVSDEARNHKLGQGEKRNLYMMMKEAVNNAIKYSGAKRIDIDVSIKKGKPAIQIKDDGKGFDTNAATDGNGLRNMKRRAQEIKYNTLIESAPDNGTIIHFQKN